MSPSSDAIRARLVGGLERRGSNKGVLMQLIADALAHAPARALKAIMEQPRAA